MTEKDVTTEACVLNAYGDVRQPAQDGYGVDIASQRADDLDQMAISFLQTMRQAQALDLACGLGGQALRMIRAGAQVTAVDAADYSKPLIAAAQKEGLVAPQFLMLDMCSLASPLAGYTFDVIVCQRAIHYLRYAEAVLVIRTLRSLLSEGGRLFISASGLHSELGNGYPAGNTVLAQRYAPLAKALAKAHAIDGQVCLYSEEDMRLLLQEGGMQVIRVFRSPFGNVKACAQAFSR